MSNAFASKCQKKQCDSNLNVGVSKLFTIVCILQDSLILVVAACDGLENKSEGISEEVFDGRSRWCNKRKKEKEKGEIIKTESDVVSRMNLLCFTHARFVNCFEFNVFAFISCCIFSVKIIDDDVDLSMLGNANDEDIEKFNLGEDAPQIVGVIDDRPAELIAREDYNKSRKWKTLGTDPGESETTTGETKKRVRSQSPNHQTKRFGSADASPVRRRDASPRRRGAIERDASPPRRQNRNESPDASPRRRERSPGQRQSRGRSRDESPPRRNQRDRDASPPRRRRRNDSRDTSPKRREKYSSGRQNRSNSRDKSPPRRNEKDRDASPPRRRRRNDSPDASPRRLDKYSARRSNRSQSRDESPPRRIKKDRDASPPRRNRKDDSDASPQRAPTGSNHKTKRLSESPPPTHKKMVKTLDGKIAGLQNASALRDENEKFKKREEELYKHMTKSHSDETEARVRKTGRRRNLEQNSEKEMEKMRKADERKAVYDRWGKGLKQIEEFKERVAEEMHEQSKPLARYANDADLDDYLKQQYRDGDPMADYFQSKSKEKGVGPCKC